MERSEAELSIGTALGSSHLLHPAVFYRPDDTAAGCPLQGFLCNPCRNPEASGGHVIYHDWTLLVELFGTMPQTMQIYMDNCENKECGRALKVLAELIERIGFVSSVNIVDKAVWLNETDPDSLQSLYRRNYADVLLLPPLEPLPGHLISRFPEVRFHRTRIFRVEAIVLLYYEYYIAKGVGKLNQWCLCFIGYVTFF